eukprot:c28514_g1_i2 orf=814-3042(-)
MSLVSSVETVDRTSGENYTTGDGRVMGPKWESSTKNTSLQYRPDLGSISLNPPFSSGSTMVRPAILDAAMNRARNVSPFSSCYTSNPLASCCVDQSNQNLLFMNQTLQESQRLSIYGAMKRKSHPPTISPPSPPDSAVLLDASRLSHNLEAYRFKSLNSSAPSQASSFCCGSSCRSLPVHISRNIQFADLPIVRGPTAFQRPACGSSAESPLQSSMGSTHSVRMEGTSVLHVPCRNRAIEESKRLKLTFEELERELLGDDTNFTSPISYNSRADGSPVVAEPAEKDWTDVIEDLLSESSSLPVETAGPMTSFNQSVISCSSRIGNSQTNARGSLVSEGTSPINPPSGMNGLLQQQQTTIGQPFQATADVTGQPQQLLIDCAAAIAENKIELASSIVTKLKEVVSTYGDPMQRLAAYMVEGLVARIESSGHCLYMASKCKDPPLTEIVTATQVLYQVCPYLKFGYMAANGAIAEAFKDEDEVHIIDFEIGEGSQWLALIKAFAARRGGPPKVRITGVDDPKLSANPGGLQVVGKRLAELAYSEGVPFDFHPVAVNVSEVQPWMLERRSGKALAVNFAFQLHHMPDESVCTTNPRDRLLQMVRALEPKVVTLIEHEANTNTAPFYPRFLETLSYFTAVFESLDVSLPRESRDRVNVEQICLARDIVNIIACEGAERVQRYELAGKWRARMTMAGFRPCPLSSYINSTIKPLLQKYSNNYRLREEGGALHLGWLDRILIVASAWQ